MTDDGVGIGAADERGGLANMRRRATRLSGDFTVTPTAPHGTTVRWSVPL
ncbi:signal transduction histidine kinase [Allocatelliglobosispora scoriae]|uniref:Signal transduction histidine kinase n=1 Tax=Allocatelliglobosispora scoriae TaxID=643052 RepID=A0A841BYR8_9ACTN|nr:signal transduction histidine kinase [Allocatelliglobosispora scoriae]